jgi:hypothetical protein
LQNSIKRDDRSPQECNDQKRNEKTAFLLDNAYNTLYVYVYTDSNPGYYLLMGEAEAEDRIMKKIVFLLICLGIIGILTACANIPPAYLGKSIDPDWPGMCTLENDHTQPTSCHVTLKHFDFRFEVEYIEGIEYRIRGQATSLIPNSSSQIRAGNFTFFLTNQGTVVDSVRLLANQARLDMKQELLKRFEAQEAFDAITATYDIVYGSGRRKGAGNTLGRSARSIPPTLLEWN